jgi:hypothetical protein
MSEAYVFVSPDARLSFQHRAEENTTFYSFFYGNGESKFRKWQIFFDSRRFKNCPPVWK